MLGRSQADGQQQVQPVIEAISQDAFSDWYRARQIKQHMREGEPWRHTSASVTPPNRHAPNHLLQCHRKAYYRARNAPKEDQQPTGVFWAGTRIEEDIVMPFLEDVVADRFDPSVFVQNSLWVDYHLDSGEEDLHVRGATDPVICTREGDPLLPTEVKTKQSLGSDTSPAAHHRAQLHAYLYGLDQTVDYPIRTGLIIYVDRDHHDIQPIQVDFDLEFWEQIVRTWAATQTEFRLDDTVPPPDPEHGWECSYCSYRTRCGQTGDPYEGEPATGFLPLVEYPRRRVESALKADGGADELTPTLAHQHPELVGEYNVADWGCPACSSTYSWDALEWDGEPDEPPVCPACRKNDRLATLRGPAPAPATDGHE